MSEPQRSARSKRVNVLFRVATSKQLVYTAAGSFNLNEVEAFEPFTFSPAGAAVYQLGPFGTAAKKLKEWDLKH